MVVSESFGLNQINQMIKEIRKILADKSETLEDGRVVIVPDFSQLDDLVDDIYDLFSLQSVNNRRELLKGFMKHIEKDGAIKFRDYNYTIKNFEEDNKTLLQFNIQKTTPFFVYYNQKNYICIMIRQKKISEFIVKNMTLRKALLGETFRASCIYTDVRI